jgi:hypothetical protein
MNARDRAYAEGEIAVLLEASKQLEKVAKERHARDEYSAANALTAAAKMLLAMRDTKIVMLNAKR